jgi:hypothetical protein
MLNIPEELRITHDIGNPELFPPGLSEAGYFTWPAQGKIPIGDSKPIMMPAEKGNPLKGFGIRRWRD